VSNPDFAARHSERATPRQSQRFRLFSLDEKDVERLRKKEIIEKNLSKADPYIERMNLTG